MPSLEVVIGLILIILFYSLLTTIIMELISSFLSFRGKHLERVLKSILSSDDKREEMLDAFKGNVVYQQLSGKYYGKKSPPSYMGSEVFRSILLKVIGEREDGSTFQEKIDNLPDENLKKALLQLWEESDYQFDVFKLNIEKWYDNVMERASGWYKRNIQKVLLLLGLIIAIVFNVDTLLVYKNLVNSSKVDLENLVSLADKVSQEKVYVVPPRDSLTAARSDTVRYLNQDLYNLIEQNISDLKDPLGIGWENFEKTSDLFFWLFKLFGWIVTAIAISKGAPFWFDLLKKAVNFRSTGGTPVKVVERAPSSSQPPTEGGKRGGMEVIDKPVG